MIFMVTLVNDEHLYLLCIRCSDARIPDRYLCRTLYVSRILSPRVMHKYMFPIPFSLACSYIYMSSQFLKELDHCAVGIIFQLLGLHRLLCYLILAII